MNRLSLLLLPLFLLLATPLRADDTVIMRSGTSAETITLKEGQTLAAEAGAARPRIGHIVLASDSTVRGVAADEISGHELRGTVSLQDVETKTLSLAAQLGAFRWSGGSAGAVDLDGGNGDVTIENVPMHQVRVANRSGGSVAFGSGSSVAGGIVLTANAGNISFTAPVNITTAGASAMSIKSCDSVAVAGGTLVTTGAPALQVSGAKLALSLDRVESSGARNGIALDHTTGTVTLRGVRVAKSSAAAILLRDAAGVRLEGVAVEGGGIEAERVAGLVISDGELRGGGLDFKDVTGNVAIIRTKVLEHATRGLYLQNGGGEASLLIDGSTVRGGHGESSAQGVLLELRGAAKLAARIEDSTFADNFSNAIHLSASDTASADVSIRGCTFRNNNAAAVLAAQGEAAIRYRIAANREISGSASTPIVISSSSKREVWGVVEENTIWGGKGTAGGISLLAGGTGDVRVAIVGNTIRDPQGKAPAAVSVMTMPRSADTVKLCADIRDNTISGSWEAPIAISNRGPAATFRVAGYRAGTSIASFLAGRNHGAAVTPTLRTTAPATVFTGADACTIPAP